MKALLIGSGSIGARHLKNLKQLHPDARVALWRQLGNQPLSDDIKPLVESVFTSETEAINWHPDVALICNPSPFHVSAGLSLAQAGADLFVEKPLSDSLTKGRELVEVSQKLNRTLFVGYNLPFDESLRRCREILQSGQLGRVLSVRAEVGQYLPDWRPTCDYRKGVTAQARLGGGVLLELSHEIDYLLWTIGDVRRVSAQLRKLGNLEIDVEDTAELTLEFASGTLGSIHLDMIRRDPARSCTWVCTEGSLAWDGLKGEVTILNPGANNRHIAYIDEKKNRNAMYVSELETFLRAVKHPQSCEESTHRALHVLEIIEAARLSSQSQQVITIGPA